MSEFLFFNPDCFYFDNHEACNGDTGLGLTCGCYCHLDYADKEVN